MLSSYRYCIFSGKFSRLFKQPKQLNLFPRFPRSMVQYDKLSLVQYDSSAAGYSELCMWFFPNVRNRDIFWMDNNDKYYPTSLRRVQITPKTSTNITRYLYSRGPVRQATNLIQATKKIFVCQKEFLFYVFSWQKSQSEKLELICNLGDRKTIFFPLWKVK